MGEYCYSCEKKLGRKEKVRVLCPFCPIIVCRKCDQKIKKIYGDKIYLGHIIIEE